MNSVSSPTYRRKREWMSAGNSEPAKLPRCFTPLMYGSALVINAFAMMPSWANALGVGSQQKTLR